MSKKVLIGVAVCVVCIVGGVALWVLQASQSAPTPALPVLEPIATSTSRERTLVGEIVEVNFERVVYDGPSLFLLQAAGTEERYTVAVPSRGLGACIASSSIADPFQLAPGDRLEVMGLEQETGEVVPCEHPEHYLRATRTETKAEFGLAFTYRKGPDGYVLEENTREAKDAMLDLLYSAVFTNTDAFAAFLNATDTREGPEHFSVQVYQNEEKLGPLQFALAYPLESNIELKRAEPVDAEVSGARAVRYSADGLFPRDTYVITQGSFAYLVEGAFDSASSTIGMDFMTFIDHIKFVPVTPVRLVQ